MTKEYLNLQQSQNGVL